jgi:predicted DsbA family dithiol-disulfide isomerase
MEFQVTFDYLCPFARNANEAVLNGLAAGREWKVIFRPFSLAQVHREEGEEDAYDDRSASGVLALQWGIAARDFDPDNFFPVHRALFAARHDRNLDIRDENVLAEAVEEAGGDVDVIAEAVASGEPVARLRKEHEESVDRWAVFGVPTFIVGDEAVFVRLMSRGEPSDIDRVLELVGWTDLNEFKRTRIPR